MLIDAVCTYTGRALTYGRMVFLAVGPWVLCRARGCWDGPQEVVLGVLSCGVQLLVVFGSGERRTSAPAFSPLFHLGLSSRLRPCVSLTAWTVLLGLSCRIVLIAPRLEKDKRFVRLKQSRRRCEWVLT